MLHGLPQSNYQDTKMIPMKQIITILLIAFATLLYGQDTTSVQLDTITPNPTSRQLIKEITEQLQQIEAAKAQASKELMLIVTGYMEDPRKLVGFTKDFKIIQKK